MESTIKASHVKLVSFEVNYGDARTRGEFSLTAKTPFGTLLGKGRVGTDGSQQDETWSLNDTDVSDDAPDLGVPHARAGRTAVLRFEKNRDQEVRELLADWLGAVLGCEL